jgi:hypothetical protein
MSKIEKERQKQNRTILFTSLLVIILLGFNTFAFYNSTKLIKNMQKENEWNYIVSVIEENQSKADIQANYLKEEIVEDISNAYKNDISRLKYDLDNFSTQSDLSKILNNRLTGKYLNVDNDNNDLFVLSTWQESKDIDLKGKIIFDKSVNCSSNGEIRDFARELSQHYNYELGYNASKRILNINKEKPIFWEYLPSNNLNHEKLTDCSLDGLKQVYMNEGLSGLKTYEILNPVYIQDKTDILGNNKITNDGMYNNSSRQLVIVQGFSISDAIESNHKLNMLSTQKSYENIISIIQAIGIFGDVLTFIIFISIIKVQNLAVELEELGDEIEDIENKMI